MFFQTFFSGSYVHVSGGRLSNGDVDDEQPGVLIDRRRGVGGTDLTRIIAVRINLVLPGCFRLGVGRACPAPKSPLSFGWGG
jgi:hypothetical protein